MAKVTSLSLYLFIIIINFDFISNILEIPLKPMKVKGIPKYKNLTIIEQGKKILGNNTAMFYDQGDSIINEELVFLANVKIGSKSKDFNLLLDTGSKVLWVAIEGCIGSYKIDTFFNPSSSSTCNYVGKKFEIEYGTGYCTGFYFSDYIEYLPKRKFKLNFGVASVAFFNVTRADGIIGLAKYYEDESESFIHMLKKSGNTDSLAFSIKFENDYFKSDVKGTMYIGEHDDFSLSGVSSCTLYSNTNFWACTLNSFSMKSSNTEVVSKIKTGIIFDTGTNAIILPIKYYNDIKNQLSKFGCFGVEATEVSIICSANGNVPDLRFQFGEKTLIIPKEYGFGPIKIDNKYVKSVVVFNGELSIIGSVFFFLFHTLFDSEKNEMKFYPLKDGLIEGGLSTFVIILICIASIAVVVLIVFTVIYCVKIRKKNNDMPTEALRKDYYDSLFPNTTN